MKFSWHTASAAIGLLMLMSAAFLALRPEQKEVAEIVQKVPSVAIMITRLPLRAGSIVTLSSVGWRRVQKGAEPSGSIQMGSGPAQLVTGGTVLRSLTAGEVVRFADVLLPEQDQSLAKLLDPGMRAVALPLDAVQGSAAMIRPEDHLDIVAQLPGPSQPSMNYGSVRGPVFVISDVRVLAVDGRTAEPPDAAAKAKRGNSPSDLAGKPMSSITVAVREDQAAVLVTAAATSPPAFILRRRTEYAAHLISVNSAQDSLKPKARSSSTFARRRYPAYVKPTEVSSPPVVVIRGQPSS